MLATVPRLRWIAVVVCMTCRSAFADQQLHGQVNWVQMQSCLGSDDVKTIRDLFVRLSKLPIDEQYRKQFADLPKELKYFVSIENYIYDTYQQPGAQTDEHGHPRKPMSLSEIHQQMAKSMIWKSSKKDMNIIKRLYLLPTNYFDDLGLIDISFADNPIYFSVLTDEGGAILGWSHGEVPLHFITIIVNGEARTACSDRVLGAAIAVMAYHDDDGFKALKKPETRIIITYKDGPSSNQEGTVATNKEVVISNGMVFDVKIEKITDGH